MALVKLAVVYIEPPAVDPLTPVTPGGNSVPHKGTTVLFSHFTTGIPVLQSITNNTGQVDVHLDPDTYILTIKKDGVAFSKNNWKVTVDDVTSQNVSVDVGSFEASFEVKQPPVPVCKLYADLVNFNGVPMRDTDILFQLMQGPSNFEGFTVFGTSFVKKTDKRGHVEADVVRGATVEVSIMSHALRRTITVPSGTVSITSSTVSGATTSIVTPTAHGLSDGSEIKVSGHSVGALDGTHEVTVVNDTTFTVPVALASNGTGGTFEITKTNLLALLSAGTDSFDIKSITIPSAPRRTLGG